MSANRSLPVEWLAQVDEICDSFESQWKHGQRPRFEAFLTKTPQAMQSHLVAELLKIDVGYRRRAGETPVLGDYLPRLPDFSGPIKSFFLAGDVESPCSEAKHSDVNPVHGQDARATHVQLKIISGPHEGEQFEFDSHQTLVVGRAPDAQWQVVKDPYFSRYHFRVETNPPECRLIDLESTNGTKVNGQRVNDVLLANGDRIECGDTIFEVRIAAPPEPGRATTLELRPGNTDDQSSSGTPGESQPPNDSADAESPAPKRVADFEIVRELGRGAMGVVYQAVHRATGRDAAVKVIHPHARAADGATQLFLREASILSQLRHPRIVEYLNLGLHQRQMYLAMEYLPIIDFSELMRTQSRPKQIRLACGIVSRVLEALQYAHERDIVHRDVKPSNILVYRIGKRVQVKLADFGLAKNYLNAGFSSISREENIRGTLGYMAPEQLINCRYAKPPCDIYGVGACLYSYLAGHGPHDLESGASAVARILNTPPISLAERAPDLPLELARAVDRALAREPSERYSSAEHMRKALQQFV